MQIPTSVYIALYALAGLVVAMDLIFWRAM